MMLYTTKEAVTEIIFYEYRLWDLYDSVSSALLVLCIIVGIVNIAIAHEHKAKQNELLQLQQIIVTALCVPFIVNIAVLCTYWIIYIFGHDPEFSELLYFIFKLSQASSTLHMPLLIYGDLHAKSYGVYVNKSRVYLCLIVAWFISIFPAVFVSPRIIFMIHLVVNILYMLTWCIENPTRITLKEVI